MMMSVGLLRRVAAVRSGACVSSLESVRSLMSSELASGVFPTAARTSLFAWTKTFSASAGDTEVRSSRHSLDLNKSGEIKPDLVKRYLSETNLSRGETNKRALAEERASFARTQHDTGSSEVQIASLTMRIKLMTEHLRIHRKDEHSRRGLMGMLERRKKLLKYLRRTDGDRYADTILRLGLKDRSFVDDKYAQ